MAEKYKRITISFTEADSDIVNYIEGLKESGKASEFIREAIREKMSKGSVITEDTIRDIIREMLPQTAPPPQRQNVSNEKVNTEGVDEDVLNAINSFDF